MAGALTLDLDGLEALGAALGAALRAGDAVLLSGEVGAGKTSLARAILAGLGHRGEVPSATWTLAETYAAPPLRLAVAHADLYRLEGQTGLDDLALDEALTEGVVLVEWPERLPPETFSQALRLHLEGAGGPARVLTWQAPGAWEGRWPPA